MTRSGETGVGEGGEGTAGRGEEERIGREETAKVRRLRERGVLGGRGELGRRGGGVGGGRKDRKGK